jgi:hypothetical protein
VWLLSDVPRDSVIVQPEAQQLGSPLSEELRDTLVEAVS